MSEGFTEAMSDYEGEGFHFHPTDEALINTYLIPKLSGQACGDFIEHRDVYGKEPWLVDHTDESFFEEDEWYYFVTRTQVSEKKVGCGQYANRKVIGDDGIHRGNWHQNSSKPIIEEATGNIIGTKQSLTFKTSKNIGANSVAIVPGSDSRWTMTEYTLPEKDRFQELVLCKIKRG